MCACARIYWFAHAYVCMLLTRGCVSCTDDGEVEHEEQEAALSEGSVGSELLPAGVRVGERQDAASPEVFEGRVQASSELPIEIHREKIL